MIHKISAKISINYPISTSIMLQANSNKVTNFVKYSQFIYDKFNQCNHQAPINFFMNLLRTLTHGLRDFPEDILQDYK